MNRRDFLGAIGQATGMLVTVGLVGCGKETTHEKTMHRLFMGAGTVTMYDTNAVALYFDGDLGPKTGVIKVDYILANKSIDLQFWHGHGGMYHRFTVTPTHFAELKKLKKIYIETTEVESHSHKLFIDPVDPQWRVKGALPVEVPVDSLIG